MDVRLLIAKHPTDSYQACVLGPEFVRGWIKTYESKLECVTDLRVLDILGPEVADEVLVDDFDVKDRILIIRTETNPETLNEAGFAEKKREVLN